MDEAFAEQDHPGQVAAPSRGIVAVLWQYRWLIVFGGVLGLVIGTLVYVQQPSVYQSGSQVLVVKKRADALPVAGGDPRLSYYEDYVSTHLVLLRSPMVVERAVKRRNLGTLRSLEGNPDPVGTIRADLTVGREASKDTTTAPSNIINLTFRGTDPSDAQIILVAVVESYRDFLDETYRNVSDNTLELITRARDLLKQDLADKEKTYREFLRQSPLLTKGSDGLNIHQSRIREFQKKETVLVDRGAEIRERLKAVERARKDGSSAAVVKALASRPQDRTEAASERALEEQLFPLLLKEKALLQDYGVDHPEVMRVRDQVAMTREYFERLNAVSRKYQGGDAETEARVEIQIDILRQELAIVETSQTALADLLKQEEKKARDIERYEIEDEAHRSDIARTAKVLDQTLKRLEEINLVRDFGGYEAKVIAAPAPGGKVSPVLWQFIAAGLLMGLLAGGGGAYLLDRADTSFRTPEEIRRRLGLPIVGHVPYLPPGGAPVTVAVAEGEPLELDPTLYALHRPSSIEAESYRSVRTALYFSTQGERHQVIQVTSPNMGDGKTTLIANLAISIAQSGRKVVLVDADMRRPRVHRLFGLTARLGLAQLMTDQSPVDLGVYASGVPGLSLLPCGLRPANPAELLTNARLEEILEELRSRFDYVLMDTPPLLAVSDPCSVAPRVDGLLLTIRVSKNGRPAAERARAVLASLPVKVLGVVVNGVGKHGALQGYGYEHYQYEYGYEYASSEPDATEKDSDPVISGSHATNGVTQG